MVTCQKRDNGACTRAVVGVHLCRVLSLSIYVLYRLPDFPLVRLLV